VITLSFVRVCVVTCLSARKLLGDGIQFFLIFTSPAEAVAKYCDEYMSVGLSVCLCVCPRGYLQNHTRDLYQIFCACCLCQWLGPLPTFTIGRIDYRREGVFFPTENALSAGKQGWECTARAKYAIYDCCVIHVYCFFLSWATSLLLEQID